MEGGISYERKGRQENRWLWHKCPRRYEFYWQRPLREGMTFGLTCPSLRPTIGIPGLRTKTKQLCRVASPISALTPALPQRKAAPIILKAAHFRTGSGRIETSPNVNRRRTARNDPAASTGGDAVLVWKRCSNHSIFVERISNEGEENE